MENVEFYYRAEKFEGEKIPVIGLGHYIPYGGKKDEFSHKLNLFYKYCKGKHRKILEEYVSKYTKIYEKRFRGNLDIDIVCVAPSSKKHKLNNCMKKLAKEFCKNTGLEYREILVRNRDIKKQHELKDKEERINNVKDSIDIVGDVKEKSILVFDNTSITGATANEILKKLKQKGARKVLFFVIGLGHKGKENDFDFNPNYKGTIVDIINKFNWPKVEIRKRIKHKQ